ncbi:hypothetical protein MERGE_001932 [Pneumocystis wakefieldiae]|uniref:Dolichol kinase n=1 Tax=Pneumocystis wakefieldiae TaxID=38082 RepID=A0A899FS79_9ASCO|nr:hypothetical protein MERGE_001932 [Pneumocystis wakefieldiae]
MRERRRRGGRMSWRGEGGLAGKNAGDSVERDGDIVMADDTEGLKERFNPYRGGSRAKKVFKGHFHDTPTEIMITGYDGGTEDDLIGFISRKCHVLITNLHYDGSVLYASVSSSENARALLKLSGSRFAGKNLFISIPDARKDQVMSTTSSTSLTSVPTTKQSTINILLQFLSNKYIHETKTLDLSSMHSNPILVNGGMFSSVLSSIKTFPALMKIAKREFPNVISVNLSSNKITSLINISTLAQTYPNLKNLNLANNLLKYYKDLDVWSHKDKLPNLQELILIGNEIRENEIKKGNEINYRSEIIKRFPNLKMLDMVPVTQTIQFDIKDSSINDFGKTILPKKICGSFFESDLIKNTVMAFLEKYFSLYDNDRLNAVSLYDQNALFSISINTIAPRKREPGIFSYSSSQFSEYISMSRNLMRLSSLDARVAKLNIGYADISRAFSSLPKTRHNFADSSLYCVDAWPLKGVLSTDLDPNGLVGIQIILHGIFFELGGRKEIKKSYDRTFIIGPHNGNITIRSDMLVIRPYGGSNSFCIDKQDETLSSNNTYEEQKQFMLNEISKKTGLNQKFSLMCLEQNQWNMEQAMNNFNILNEKAFSVFLFISTFYMVIIFFSSKFAPLIHDLCKKFVYIVGFPSLVFLIKTNSIQIYKQNIIISLTTFILVFLHSNFKGLFFSFDTIYYISSILPSDLYFSVLLHLSILSLINSIAFPSLTREEISLASHALTGLLRNFVYFHTNLPHELFLILAFFGPIVAICPAIPFLKEYVRITKISYYRRTRILEAKRIRYAIFSYFIIGISIFIILQFGVKLYLTGHRNLIFWFINYLLYEKDSKIRQKILLWWFNCLIFTMLFIKVFLYAQKSERPINHENERISGSKLDRRRKLFHGLVIIMFLPTLYLDPLFSNISFSIAFALFCVIEVIRILALPPYGIFLHLFLSQFTDERDNKGNIIVSYLYLLLGCACPLWLDFIGITLDEQNQYQLKLKAISGILCLGFGDSAASMIGKKFGRLHWPNSKKTVEGTFAFILAVLFGGALVKYMCWINDVIIWIDFFLATIMTALFEAFSSQNDNVLIPIYMWSLLSLKG